MAEHRHHWNYFDTRERLRIEEAVRWCRCGNVQTKKPRQSWETKPFPASEIAILVLPEASDGSVDT